MAYLRIADDFQELIVRCGLHWSRAFAALIGLAFTMAITPSVFAQGAKQAADSASVEVQLLLDKDTYKLDDPINTRILLINRSKELIYIRGPLWWGIGANVEIWARDVSGAPLSLNFIADSPQPPPRSKDDFVRLEPDEIYGVMFEVAGKYLGIQKPGKYEITAIYHSRDYNGLRFGLPSWKGEDQALRAIPVVISVTP